MVDVDNMNVLETDVLRITVHESGFTELLIKDNAVFDTTDIIEGKNFITGFLKGKKAYILLELESDAYVTKEARELASSPQHSDHHGAVAICNDKLAYKIMGNLYIKINKPQSPTRFFTERGEAVNWLTSLIR